MCAKIDSKYNESTPMYWSAQAPLFSQIVLRPTKQSFLFCNISIMSLMCADVVEESCLLLSEKINEIKDYVTNYLMTTTGSSVATH